jgi:hypothetical protein
MVVLGFYHTSADLVYRFYILIGNEPEISFIEGRYDWGMVLQDLK